MWPGVHYSWGAADAVGVELVSYVSIIELLCIFTSIGIGEESVLDRILEEQEGTGDIGGFWDLVNIYVLVSFL